MARVRFAPHLLPLGLTVANPDSGRSFIQVSESDGTVESPASSGPVSPTFAPYPPSTAYTSDDLWSALASSRGYDRSSIIFLFHEQRPEAPAPRALTASRQDALATVNPIGSGARPPYLAGRND